MLLINTFFNQLLGRLACGLDKCSQLAERVQRVLYRNCCRCRQIVQMLLHETDEPDGIFPVEILEFRDNATFTQPLRTTIVYSRGLRYNGMSYCSKLILIFLIHDSFDLFECKYKDYF